MDDSSTIFDAKNGNTYTIRKISPSDFDSLMDYFGNLSPETRKLFGPHPFDRQSLVELFLNSVLYIGYIAVEKETNSIVAYSIIKVGYLEHDSSRLQSYGLELSNRTDCTYAPSVSDDFQNLGIGKGIFQFIINELKEKGFDRVILWGGVQADNKKAVRFYLNQGFREVGQFEFNGQNLDMVKDI